MPSTFTSRKAASALLLALAISLVPQASSADVLAGGAIFDSVLGFAPVVTATGNATATATSPGTGTTSAFASADVAAGTLQVIDITDSLFEDATSTARIANESIHIVGSITGQATITLIADVDGFLSGSNFYGDWAYFVMQTFVGGGLHSAYGYQWIDQQNTTRCQQLFVDLGTCFLDVSVTSDSISLSVTVDDLNRDIIFAADLIGQSYDGGTASFAAKLRVLLPDGLSFTSDSGLFLTQTGPGNTVPEPTPLALLSIALLAGLRNRRRSP